MQIESSNKFTMRVVPIAATVLILAFILGIIWYVSQNTDSLLVDNAPLTDSNELVAFGSDEEFVAYMEDAAQVSQRSMLSAESTGAAALGANDITASAETTKTTADTSTTNVQVAGIDEPDMVKTDGERLYVKAQFPYIFYSEPAVLGTPEAISAKESSTAVASDVVAEEAKLIDPALPNPEEYKNETSVVQAVPADSMKLWPGIEPSGDMLFDDETLVILGDSGVTAYSTPEGAAPKKLWNVEYANGYYSNARLYNGSVYLVLQQYVDYTTPCPFVLLKGTEDISVPCGDILRPVQPVNANGTTSIVKLDLATGAVQAKQVIVSDNGSTTLAMFEGTLFLVQQQYVNEFDFMQEVMQSEVGDLFPSDVENRIQTVVNFDISQQSKALEISLALSNYYESLDQAARDDLEKQLKDRITTYVSERKRELQRSTISAIQTEDLRISGTTTIPGAVLNQFSIDYYKDHLRVFTTVQANSGFWLAWPDTEPVNDLYILDNQMQIAGQVQDIAPGEQVYASRFMGDKAYLVTFEQIDPFFVFDVSNPAAPRELGQLKLPGYSSYLHQVSSIESGDKKTVVLGVGQEEDDTKLTLFDATDPAVPTELNSLKIDASWTDVNYNHHAFLQDAENQVVFIPANGNGYIISYANNALKEVAKITDLNAQRAVYINDVLYVVGTEKIVAVKRGGDWAKLGEVEL